MTDPGGAEHSPVAPRAGVRLGATVVAAVAVLAGRALIGLGVRRAPEGWRRTVGILLRSEPTRFALSAFGLRVPDAGAWSEQLPTSHGQLPERVARTSGVEDAPTSLREQGSIETRTAHALLSFLAREPDAHFSLEWRRAVTIRRRLPFVDLFVLTFAREGTLEAIRPFLSADGTAAPAADVQARVHEAVVAGYNRTARLAEVERPRALLEQVRAAARRGARSQAAEAYARRLLAACCLSFEPVNRADPAQRFCPPHFTARRGLGFGYLSWVARQGGGGAVDLWVSAHHVGLDGVPLQDLLGRLERAWGTVEPVAFPPAMCGRAFVGPYPCHAPGERPVDHLITFVDLSPVLALRRRLNARYTGAIGGDVTLGMLVAWLLSQEPEFTGVRIASTVDVAASGGYERDVDVVPIRPADYATGGGPWGGFVEFAREFNRLIAASRARRSPLRAALQTAGLLPPWAHATVVRSNPAALDATFGSLCVTIVRDARVFVAPMTDMGLGHGFLAIGSATLPSAEGRLVASISIKGDAGRIAHYPAILQRAIDRSALLLSDGAG
jgi:hypothetical protein